MSEQVLEGVWRFVARHPDWESGEDWEPEVAWWAVRTADGLVLIDPLLAGWEELDGLVAAQGPCAAVIRTVFWHERSCPAAAARYGCELWALPAPPETPLRAYDRAAAHGQRLPGGLIALEVTRASELALWLPGVRALVFGDAMLRDGEGRLNLCPPAWVGGEENHARLRSALSRLPELEAEHVLVSHGPLVLGDAATALAGALG